MIMLVYHDTIILYLPKRLEIFKEQKDFQTYITYPQKYQIFHHNAIHEN